MDVDENYSTSKCNHCPRTVAIDVKKVLVFFSSPAWMSFTKLSLAGNNEIIPGQGEFG